MSPHWHRCHYLLCLVSLIIISSLCDIYCYFVTPLSLVRGRVERSRTDLTPPHTNVLVLSQENVVQWLSLFYYLLLIYVHHFCIRLSRLSYFVYIFTLCISGLLKLPLFYGLLFIVEGHYWTCRSLNSTVISWWLSHGQSYHLVQLH